MRVMCCLLCPYAVVSIWPQIRAELAEKELILLQKEQELLDKDQTLLVLKEEVSKAADTPTPRPAPAPLDRNKAGHLLSPVPASRA